MPSHPAKKRKFAKVISEFKSGSLKIGTSDKKVSNPKQAIAIALSETGQSKAKRRAKAKRRRSVRKA